MTDINRPLLGEPNAPCRTCGAPLAADQRYCLQCGTRRAEARLPFLEILARQVPAGAAGPTATAAAATTRQTGPAAWLGRVSTNAAAVAGVACLLLALGVGVLIGGIGSDDSAASPGAPQIITVGGAAPAAAAASTTAPPATETTPDTTTTPDKKSSKKTSSSSSSDSKSTSSAVKDLDKTSGSDYSKKSAKLPKTLGTGGAPPPKDTSGKAIGGGSDTEEIG
ncbi:MAG TPA: hypothetical protein VNT55_20480 [Baekduia sp.]|nr:hypothetical protein [Baekduia sp.]